MGAAGSWRPGTALTYALSVPNTQVNAQQPVGFAGGGGTVRIVNAGTTDIFIVFFSYAQAGNTLPVLTFPVSGSPPTGQPGTFAAQQVGVMVAAVGASGAQPMYVDIPATADSFSAIGGAAGPSIIYVQRGEGTGP